ncbi:hypothetical protein G647_05114 [Cladophialophora carrionii CBS 160.54]|uniref:Uncharacterized protein n=1 Tax=Cladophialophora carrionii CBS 160.54 TaxID=1279043 RepID=V9D8R4_9EURO|nr:uncharacterized protein G647_05114 [Cladophialophora carrionii CBS 160.54]ETI23314.1 hypothetical protein G647_05114 [Cladophialophora carrionii CBS 160.54]
MYFEIAVTNTTSVYLAFQQDQNDPRTSAGPLSVQDRIGLFVEIDDDLVFGVRRPFPIVQVAEDLDPSRTYRLRVTQTGTYPIGDSSFRFQGVWLDRPPSQKDGPSLLDPANSAVGSTPGTLVPQSDGPQGARQPQDSLLPRRRAKPLIELFTCEVDRWLHCHDPRKDAAELAKERVHTWYKRLESELGADVALVSTTGDYFSRDWFHFKGDGNPDAPVSLYFFTHRVGCVGRPEDCLKQHPWPFKSYRPAVLLLQLGFSDFTHIFKMRPTKPHLDDFLDSFIKDYVALVKKIRARAYPSDGTTTNARSNDGDPDPDGSYIYNSAPSTLPIFLVTPFSAHGVFVTRKLTLAKVMTDVLARIVATLHAHGDISTHLIDTAGWLDPRRDFEKPPGFRPPWYPHHNGKRWRPLTDAAATKVAALLASHVCPYIQQGGRGERSAADGPARVSNGSALAPAFGGCAFDQYDSYLGNVYVPDGVQLDRALLERRIESIKEKFQLVTPAQLKAEGQTFLHRFTK